jgi:biopolymer transport protein ExbD
MKKRRKRKKNLIIVPIASMGDIAFLLIIFFMVASQISRQRHQIKPPRSLDTYKLKDAQITVTIDAGGACFLQGEKLYNVDALESQVQLLLKGRTTDEQRTVIFRCDKSVPNEAFEPAIDAIVKAGGLLGLVGEEGEPVGAEE